MVLFNEPVPPRFERTVGATEEEFARQLRKAWPDGVVAQASNRFSLVWGELRLEIVVIAQGARRLGAIELPSLNVTYDFHGGDETSRRRLLHMLDRAMQRGGG